MSAPDYISVEEAIALPGLRIALTRGAPGPWGVAARAFFDLKGIAYRAVCQEIGEPNEALRQWTGQSSAPVAVLDDERPRAHWSEILLLAERLAPEPRLIPEDQDERTLMWGLSHEICGEDGLGWTLRLLILTARDAAGQDGSALMRQKYSSGTSIQHSRLRLNALIEMLARRLKQQAEGGSDYFLGRQMSAVDIYWTAFSNLLVAMAEEACIMPDYYRQLGDITRAHLDRPLPQILIDHRDRILRDNFILPIEC